MRRGGNAIGARAAVLAGLFVVATLVLLWPIPARWTSALAGAPGDNYVFAWNIWWFREALWRLHVDPFHTPMLLHPDGANLAYHTTTLLNTVPGSIAALALPLPVVFNMLVLLQFFAAAFVTYGLARHVLRAAGARDAVGPAVFAAIAYAFAPFHIAHLGHLNIMTIWPVPAAGWAMSSFVTAPTVRGAALVGAALGAAILADGNQGLAAGLLVAALLVVAVVWRRRTDAPRLQASRRPALHYVGAALVPLVLLAAPVVVPMLGRGAAGVAEVGAAGGAHEGGADLLSWIAPSPFHPLWGDAVSGVYTRFTGFLSENVVFPTFTVWALALVGWWRGGALARRWFAIALAFAVLASGPFLHVAGRDGIEIGDHTLRLPLPKVLIDVVPLVAGARAATRFAVVVQLGLAIAASVGLCHVARRGAGSVLVATAIAAFVVEALAWPVPTTPVELPTAYRPLLTASTAVRAGSAKAQPGHDALLEIPPAHAGAKIYQLYQTYHGRPLLGGRLARMPSSAFDRLHADPFLSRLGGDSMWSAHDGLVSLAGLDSLDVRWVMLHRDLRASVAIERVLARAFERRAEDAGDVLFERSRGTQRAGSAGSED